MRQMSSKFQKYPQILRTLGWERLDCIIIQLLICSIKLLDYISCLLIFFKATINSVFFSTAAQTLPNFPLPIYQRISKSQIFQLFVSSSNSFTNLTFFFLTVFLREILTFYVCMLFINLTIIILISFHNIKLFYSPICQRIIIDKFQHLFSQNLLYIINHTINQMNCCTCCLHCCKCVAFFGILFYICMGIIVLTQSQFLTFPMDSNTNSGVACFIVAIIEAVIFILLIVVEGRSTESNVARENYVPFDSQRERPRESTFKGIAMMNISQQMKSNKQEEDLL